MKSHPYKPHIIQYNSHRNTRRNNLSLMMQNPNPGWDFHIPPNHRMIRKISLEPFTLMPYSKHECGISYNTSIKTHPGLLEAIHLNPPNCDSTSQSNITKPSSDWSLSKPSRALDNFSNQSSMTSYSTCSFYRAPKHLSNQGSRTSNSTHQGL